MDSEIVSKLREQVEAHGYDAIVGTSLENTTYAGGFMVPSYGGSRPVMAIIPQSGKTRQIVVDMEESLARASTALDEVVAYNEFTEDPMSVFGASLRELIGDHGTVGIELDSISQSAYSRLTAHIPGFRLVDGTESFTRARTLKTAAEIDSLRRVGRAAHATHHEALTATRAGDTELQLAARTITGLLERGADSVYPPVVGSGERSWHANAPATERRLQPGDVIRVDLFGSYKGYLSDVARTAVVGRPAQEQEDIWKLLVELRQQAFDSIRPGASTRSIYDDYVDRLRKHDFEPIDFLGHGLGLAFHEPPFIGRYSDSSLETGMVLAIEPLVFLPDKNWGFQLEDEVVVTESGYELITNVQADSELIQVAL